MGADMTAYMKLLARLATIAWLGLSPAAAADGSWKYQADPSGSPNEELPTDLSGQPLTISAGKSSYRLAPVGAANWRAPFDGCG
jgi:hypothetical protein